MKDEKQIVKKSASRAKKLDTLSTSPSSQEREGKNQDTEFSPALGGIIGAIAGAAIGALIATTLKDEKARKTLVHYLGEIKKQGIETIKEIKNDEDIRRKVKNHFVDAKETLTKDLH